jgi:hypothetical protein
VRLGGGEEPAHLPEAVAEGERPLEAALVRDEHRRLDRRRELEPLKHLLGVGELRDHVRPDEGRDLDALEPARREQTDQSELVVRRDDLRLVLEAVARPHLADPDTLREALAHRPPG